MFTYKDIREQVRFVISECIEKSRPVTSAWVTTEICNLHPMPPAWIGDDCEFRTLMSISGTQQLVRDTLRKIKNAETEDNVQGEFPGLQMPGYNRLQRAYFVGDQDEEQETSVLIPLETMTDEQVEAKIGELKSKIVGLSKHVQELERYLENRRMVS